MKIGDLAPGPPKNVRTEGEIMTAWEGDRHKPLVSISCPTFNHIDYIEDAIRGFLIQETEFPFNVVIHDDASTDGTANVVRDYERRYPNIIKGVYQEKNIYSQGIGRGRYMRPFLKGKYIASCEGDDYWMDPKKLQIQVDFLEKNPEYVISGHDAFILNDERRVVSLSKLSMFRGENAKDLAADELIAIKGWVLSMARVYRNLNIFEEPESRFILNGDRFFLTRIGWFGKSKYHAEIRPAAYRQHGGGVWSLQSKDDRRAAAISSELWMARYYRRIGRPDVASLFDKKARMMLIKSSQTRELVKEMWARVFPFRKLRKKIRVPGGS